MIAVLLLAAQVGYAPVEQVKLDGLTTDVVLALHKPDWRLFAQVYKSKNVPLDSELTGVRDLRCRREAAKEKPLGWQRYYQCDYTFTYASSSGPGSTTNSEAFARPPRGRWTNALITRIPR